jgi:energy-coupling factor transport system permease protein
VSGSGRTTYRPDPWALPEWLVCGSGAVAAIAVFVDVHRNPADFFLASVTDQPPVPLLAAAGILFALLPAVLSPPAPVPSTPSGARGPGSAGRVEVPA